jgi:GNAT superfamily N-acetyltransferase
VRIEIQEFLSDHIPRIAATRGGAAWKSDHRWSRYLAEQGRGLRQVLVAEAGGAVVAYGSLALISQNPVFRSTSIPEIQDLVVAENHRCAGLGARMVHALEDRARAAGYLKVGIGVGLYRDYGPAQRLYCRLGYIPDGLGVTYKNVAAPPMSTVTVDDHLVLWLLRDLQEDPLISPHR